MVECKPNVLWMIVLGSHLVIYTVQSSHDKNTDPVSKSIYSAWFFKDFLLKYNGTILLLYSLLHYYSFNSAAIKNVLIAWIEAVWWRCPQTELHVDGPKDRNR